MIRFTLASSVLMLGGLLAPAALLGQDSPREAPPAGKAADQPGPPAEGQTKAQSEEIQRRHQAEVEAVAREALKQIEAAVAAATRARVDASVALQNAERYKHVTNAVKQFQDDLEAENKAGRSSFDVFTTTFGLTLADADDALRAQLQIAPQEGVVVVGVKEGSLADQAGLKPNDVLLSLGGNPAKSWGQVKQLLLKLGKEALMVKLIREGKPRQISMVGPEHGLPPEAVEYWVGVPVSPVDPTLRSHLPELPAETGLIVNDVVNGSPAAKFGVMKNDVLVFMDGQALKNSDDFIAQIQASKGKSVPLRILRVGKPMTIAITPAKRAHPAVFSRKTPDQGFSVQVVRPNMAIEVDPFNHPNPAGQTTPAGNLTESRSTGSGTYTLYAPYSGVLFDPYSLSPSKVGNFSGTPSLIQPPAYPWIETIMPYLQPEGGVNWLSPTPTPAPAAVPNPATDRIEAQLKEIVAKMEEIHRTLDTLKKSPEK